MGKLKLKNTNLTRKSHIPTNNLDINKKVVSEKVFSGKKDLKCFIGYENAKQLDLYAYSFQKWVDVKEILKEPNIYVFFDKKVMNYQENIMKFVKKSAITSKKNLIVNL